MIEHRHPLIPPSPGTTRELLSLHYGLAGSGRKATIQASLHADEVPGLLVAHHLRRRLAALEAAGALRGEIVLVPYANPVGLAQRMMQAHLGRFDFASGHNFNRYYADLVPQACDLLEPALRAGTAPGVELVRDALRRACAGVTAETELESLRRTLLGLAIDADVVLDLHCDNEAVLHLYTATECWPEVEPLARLLGARAVLTAAVSGDEPFDEACSTVWPRIAEELGKRLGRPVSLPAACTAVTVELRGETDVRHDLAEADAARLVDYLACRGLVDGAPGGLPPLPCEPTRGAAGRDRGSARRRFDRAREPHGRRLLRAGEPALRHGRHARRQGRGPRSGSQRQAPLRLIPGWPPARRRSGGSARRGGGRSGMCPDRPAHRRCGRSGSLSDRARRGPDVAVEVLVSWERRPVAGAGPGPGGAS